AGGGAEGLGGRVGGGVGMGIGEVAIDTGQPWARRHLRAIELAYGRAAGWARHEDGIRAFYAEPWQELATLAVANACWLAGAVGIATPSRLASELTVTATDPTGKLVEACRARGGATHPARPGGVPDKGPHRSRHA